MMDSSGEDNAEADYHSLVTRSAGEYVRTVEGETEPSVKKKSLSRKAEFVKCEEHGKLGQKSWTAINDVMNVLTVFCLKVRQHFQMEISL